MIIYVEYVIIDNMVIDLLILNTTKHLAKLNTTKLRLVLSSIIGTVFALVSPLFPNIINLLTKPLLAIIMTYIAFNPKQIKKFLVCYLLFFLVTFVYGGAFLGICEMFGIKFLVHNGVMYEYKFPVGLAILICAITYVCIKNLIKYCFQKHAKDKLQYKVKFICGEREIYCTAFLDTGNNLSIDGKPITIINYKIFSQIYPKISLVDILQRKNLPLKNLKYKSVENIIENSQKILTFEIDKMKIEDIEIKNAILGLTLKNLSEIDCDSIISSKIIQYGDKNEIIKN